MPTRGNPVGGEKYNTRKDDELASEIQLLAVIVRNLGIGATAVEKTYTTGYLTIKERIEF